LTDERRRWLELALAICDEADPLALGRFRRDLTVGTKPDRTLVTEADTAIERLARERISRAHPGHGLVGEEYGTEAGSAPTRWYIDPIDGTHNFVRGVPIFATLLAVEHDGELQVGVISAPALGERWYATRDGGAWAVGARGTDGPRRIRASSISAVGDAQVLYGSARDIDRSGLAPGFRSLVDEAWRERGFGDFWGYALLAEGAAEVMVEVGLAPWDAAAPALIVEEAGGRWSDWSGARRLDSRTFLATNGVLHDQVLARLKGEGEPSATRQPAPAG
jgi:histidinol-phosphatase